MATMPIGAVGGGGGGDDALVMMARLLVFQQHGLTAESGSIVE